MNLYVDVKPEWIYFLNRPRHNNYRYKEVSKISVNKTKWIKCLWARKLRRNTMEAKPKSNIEADRATYETPLTIIIKTF